MDPPRKRRMVKVYQKGRNLWRKKKKKTKKNHPFWEGE